MQMRSQRRRADGDGSTYSYVVLLSDDWVTKYSDEEECVCVAAPVNGCSSQHKGK